MLNRASLPRGSVSRGAVSGGINRHPVRIRTVVTSGLIWVGVQTLYKCRLGGLSWSRVFGGSRNCNTTRPAARGAVQTGLSVSRERYPRVRRDDSVCDVLHGVKVKDPYRWLEDPESEETKKFVEDQNQLSGEVLLECKSRDSFKSLLTALYNYPKYGTPFKRGGRYYYYYNSGLQPQYVLCQQEDVTTEGSVMFDPNTLSEDGTVALGASEFSDDGNLMAYSLNTAGSDWAQIKVLRIPAGVGGAPEILKDVLERVKIFSIAWSADNMGFFYSTFPAPSEVDDLGTTTDLTLNQKLFYHIVGQSQDKDVVVFATPDHPTWLSSAQVTDDGRYLILYISEGCLPANRIYVVDLQEVPRDPQGALDFSSMDFFTGSAQLPVQKLVDDFEASYSYIANEGELFFFKTNYRAPRYRIVATSLSSPGPPSSWRDIIPEHPKDLLKSAVALKGDHLVIRWLSDVVSALQLHSLKDGSLMTKFEMPGVGSVGAVSGTRKSTELFFSFSSFADPGSIYRVDVGNGEVLPSLLRTTQLKVDHNPLDYETKQVFYQSKDGTRIPMFITHRKGLDLDGNNPTLLYGYGGFNHSLEPSFSATRLAFIRGYNGVYACANIRGGGEYGIEWRDAGSCRNKQNCFDDFQCAAEYLVAEKYTSPRRLTIQGGSNGGLLMMACANQRPDLYAAVIGQVGVLDMLRFHKFTVGHAWMTDYGDPNNEDDLHYLYRYSPLHNVHAPDGGAGQYPAIILATGDHDDRVVPLHSLKMIATLQHELVHHPGPGSPQRNPLIARVEVRAGHGAGKPTEKIINEAADLMAFAAAAMEASWVESEL